MKPTSSRVDLLMLEAHEVQLAAANIGEPIKRCAALEMVARRHGYKNWDTARALAAEADRDAGA